MEPGTARSSRHSLYDARSRRRTASLVFGGTGLASLFGSGIATLVFPGAIVPLMAVMVAGVVLLLVAFSLAKAGTFRRPVRPAK